MNRNLLFVLGGLLMPFFLLSQNLSQEYHKLIERSRSESIDSLINKVNSYLPENEQQAALAELYFLKGRNDLASDYLKTQIDAFLQIENQNHELLARLYKNFGLVQWNQGKDEDALTYLNQSLSIYGKLNTISPINQADILNNMGLVYANLSVDQALAYYQKALAIYQKDQKKSIDKIIQTSINISLIQTRKNDFKSALINLNQALSDWKALYSGKALPTEAFILANIGNIYSMTADYILAEDYFTEAVAIYTQNFGDKNAELANVFMQLGDLKLKQNKYVEALEFNHKALTANTFSFTGNDDTNYPELENIIKPNLLLVTIMRRVIILENFYFGYSLKNSHLIEALNAIDYADKLINFMRNTTPNKKDLLALSDLAAEIYEDGQRIALQLDEVSLFKKDYLIKAFQLAEKSKSSILFSALVETEAKEFAGIPQELIDEEKTLEADLAYLSNQLNLVQTQTTKDEIRSAYLEKKRAYEQLVERLEQTYPDYFELKHVKPSLSLTAIQDHLKNDEAILEYSIAPKSNEIYLYIITKESISFERITESDELIKYLRAYRNTLLYNIRLSFQDISYELYSRLIPIKLDKNIKRLIIIPDGELSNMPFEALLTMPANDQLMYYDLKYLIHDFELSYGFSAMLLQKAPRQQFENSSLLISPIEFNNSAASLPGSLLEIESINQLCIENSIKATAMTYQDASEMNFKSSELSKYKFIHFATHGTVNLDNPELSAIYFNDDSLSSEDGLLYVGEVYGLTINADLVVLSACETGLGQISRGEGVVGLGQAFAYSGANNLILSLWKVADQSTSELMNYFYTSNIKSNSNYAGGLRAAKLDLISSKTYNSPYYWAPFILWGK